MSTQRLSQTQVVGLFAGLLSDPEADTTPAELEQMGRDVLRDLGARAPGHRMGLAVAAAGVILPPVCAAVTLWVAWQHRADPYPVIDTAAILERWSWGAMAAAVSSGMSLMALVALVWVDRLRGGVERACWWWHRVTRRPCGAESGQRGCTVLEVVCGLGILATLVAIWMPGRIIATERAREGVCQSNVRQIAAVLLGYAQDHDGYMPPPQRLDTTGGKRHWITWLEAVGVEGIRCPDRGADNRWCYGYNADYLWHTGPGRRDLAPAIVAEPARTVLVGDGAVRLFPPSAGPHCSEWMMHSGGMTVGWLDGHVTHEGRGLMGSDSLWDRR